MGKKGIKSKRNQGEIYDETKSEGFYVKLTPIASQGLDNLASDLNLSKSQLIERLGRGTLPIFLLIRSYIRRYSQSENGRNFRD
jgi:hypothetical protein